MVDHHWAVGDGGPALRLDLGDALDEFTLTGATVVLYAWDAVTGASVTSAASCSIIDETEQVVEYVPEAAIVAEARDLFVVVVATGGDLPAEGVTFPNDGPGLLVRVHPPGAPGP